MFVIAFKESLLLPITQIYDELAAKLIHNNAIVVAPPGAGKSTSLPLFLLSLSMFDKQKIIMLQPRRVAARNIALYLAEQLNEPVGQTVGYRVRAENKTSASTRLEIVTEGILTRMLQSAPGLEGIGLIIFDEFHERSIHADFSLALCLEVQHALRDDLRLLVMSATLDTQAMRKVLPDAPVLESIGRSYPVDIRYIQATSTLPMAMQVKQLVGDIWSKHQQDMLIFLPGAYEITQCADALNDLLGADVVIHTLFAALSKEQQQAAIVPNRDGKRKIVLATNIAQTSLTIEGIEVVIDSGIEKYAIFDLRRDVTHLTTQKISQASATQRAGRAGRLMSGTCYRLWLKEQQQGLLKQSAPEILQSDLSTFILEAAIWGSKIQDLVLIDCPSDAQIRHGQEKLCTLGLLNPANQATELGRQVNRLGGDVNIATMLVLSRQLSGAHQSLACAIAALLESKDPLPSAKSVNVDERLRFLLQQPKHSIWPLVRQWHKKLGLSQQAWPMDDTGLVLAFGFTPWIGKQTSAGRFLLANGSGASLASAYAQSDSHDANHALLAGDWIVVCNMQITDRQSDNAVIRYAQGIELKQLVDHFSEHFVVRELVSWDEKKQRISAISRRCFARIEVSKMPLASPPAYMLLDTWSEVIKRKLRKEGIDALGCDVRARQLIIRSCLARDAMLFDTKSSDNINASFPDMSVQGLIDSLDQWLLPYLEGKTTWQQIVSLPFYQLLNTLLNYQQQSLLNECLPETYLIPTGRRAAIIYALQGTALLSVRIQEMYGLQQHPNLLQGKLPLTCELLSPAKRPLQTTQDIVGFWSGSYREIQKEMKGRYPRHFWPDDPSTAKPTAATKKKM